ncbi:MAG TPA: AAA family ATPase, partial [Ktedonobacterales bacterium]|nr:AAA family ATPase [Ktedonobacterales bacterium]
MAHLKRLELHGFKSFAQRSSLEFSPGITAIVGPNGSGKCLVGSSLVTLADGRDIPIRDLVDDALRDATSVETLDDGVLSRENPHDIEVVSLNPETLRLEHRPVTAFVRRTAPDHLLRIRTRSGREVTATPYHPLFTLDHGQLRALKAEELAPGVRIGLPRRLPTEGKATRLDGFDILEQFSEEDGVFVSNSPALRAWADTNRASFKTWVAWRQSAQVPATQLSGVLNGQAVNVAVLSRLAHVVETPPPVDGRLKSHGSVSIRIPETFSADLARFLGLIIAEG